MKKESALQRGMACETPVPRMCKYLAWPVGGSYSRNGNRFGCTQVDQEAEEKLEEEGEKKHAKGPKQKGGDAGRGNEAVPGTGSGNLTEAESRAEGNADTMTGCAIFLVFHTRSYREHQGRGQPRSYWEERSRK